MKTTFLSTLLCSCACIAVNAANQPAGASDEQRCAALRNTSIGGGRVDKATFTKSLASFRAGLGVNSIVSEDQVTPPVPFCRVEATVIPAPGAEIKIEVWLPPEKSWNGHFFGTANGGAAGSIVYTALVNGLERGYAVANTDVGSHADNTAEGGRAFRFGLGKPELVQNYVHRGIHAMSVLGKEVTKTFYERAPAKSIFAGCSGGGYEAIGEALRYPGDYDGILAGDPAINFAALGLYQGYSYNVTHRTAQSAIPADKLPLIADAALSQCDALDGLADGIIDDPRRCRMDFRRLECPTGDSTSCLSKDQIVALSSIYEGLRDPRNGILIYPGFPPGAELSGGAKTRISNLNTGSLINPETPAALIWVLGPAWKAESWMSFDFGKQAEDLRVQMQPYENAKPDLNAFRARGGKFILYTGWADPNLNPYDIVNFFEAVQAKAGGVEEARQFSRLFMVPGMYHCAGGPGPNSFGQVMAKVGKSPDEDLIFALDRWVTGGEAPEQVVATKFKDDKADGEVELTRPLCAYPKVARYIGRGHIDRAEAFVCTNP